MIKPNWLKTDIISSECRAWECIDYSLPLKNSCSNCFNYPDTSLTRKISVGYLSHSFYASHLKHYFKYFPRENFKIIRFEDLKEKGDTTIFNDVVNWLGIEMLSEEEWGSDDTTNSNDYPPILPDEEDFLVQFFKQPNQELYELLGRDFNWKS